MANRPWRADWPAACTSLVSSRTWKPLSEQATYSLLPRHSGGEKHQSVEMSPPRTRRLRGAQRLARIEHPCCSDCGIAGTESIGKPRTDASACGEFHSSRKRFVLAGGL